MQGGADHPLAPRLVAPRLVAFAAGRDEFMDFGDVASGLSVLEDSPEMVPFGLFVAAVGADALSPLHAQDGKGLIDLLSGRFDVGRQRREEQASQRRRPPRQFRWLPGGIEAGMAHGNRLVCSD